MINGHEEETKITQDLMPMFRWLLTAFVSGLAVITFRFSLVGFFGFHSGRGWIVQGDCLTGLLWALGWFAAAFLFGFIFGIPKSLQNASKPNPNGVSSVDDGRGIAPYQLRVNTNLEEISDWLTKILVGATLTQLVKVPSLIAAAARYMSNGMAGVADESFAASIVVYFASLGFLSGYVLTRTFFSRAFVRADQPFSPGDIKLLQSASIALGSKADAPMGFAVQQAAQKIRAIAVTDALSGSEAADVAKAAILAGDTAKAQDAAKLALDKTPGDPRNHLNYAIALYSVDRKNPLIMDELERARTLVDPKVDPRTAEDIYNSIIYLGLYLDPPDGFTKAIQYGEAFVKQVTPRDPSIWINLACAYGQMYRYVKNHGGSEIELSRARTKTLDAIKHALNLQPATASRLRELLHGSGPSSLDNDLSAFETDEEFISLIERAPQS